MGKMKEQADQPRGDRPQYVARARQREGSDFMQTIGAAWPWKNGDGFVVKLHSVPTDWKGEFILATPKEGE